MEIQKLLVNSEIAKSYLKKNTNNGRPKKAHILRDSNVDKIPKIYILI